jgi:transcriptional regulator with XRE-family HTH domain
MSTRSKRFGTKDLQDRLGKLTLGEFLRSWRMTEDLSQRQFAKKLKMSAANLCDVEKGRKGMSPLKAQEIAKILGYSPTVLVRLAIEDQLDAAGLSYSVEVKHAG